MKTIWLDINKPDDLPYNIACFTSDGWRYKCPTCGKELYFYKNSGGYDRVSREVGNNTNWCSYNCEAFEIRFIRPLHRLVNRLNSKQTKGFK